MSSNNNNIVFYLGLVAFDHFDYFAVANNIYYRKFLAVFVIIWRETRDLDVNKIAPVQSHQVLTVEFRDIPVHRMNGVFDSLDIVTDKLSCDVVQLIRWQVEITAEICIHVDLQSTVDFGVTQIVFPARQHNFGVFDGKHPIFAFLGRHFAEFSGQFQEIAFTMIFFRSTKHEFVVKPKDVVSDNDVRVFFLNEVGPRQE